MQDNIFTDYGKTEPIGSFNSFNDIPTPSSFGETEPIGNDSVFDNNGPTEYGGWDAPTPGGESATLPVGDDGGFTFPDPMQGGDPTVNAAANFQFEGSEPTQVVSPEGNYSFMPVVGWLVCIEGNDRGRDFRLHSGYNSIGKNAENDVSIPSDGTIDGKTIPTVQATLKENGGDGYGEAEDIVKFAYDYVVNWVKNDTASYVDFDAQVNLLKNYLNTYTPAYNNAAATAQTAAEKGKAAIENLMAAQKAELISEMKDLNTINTFVEALNDVVALADKQSIVDDPNATDYTAFIKNPKLEAETGWTFDKGNGNNNTAGGQWLDGSSTRYIDSYNGSGLQGYIAQQLITGLPNGTYTVGVYTRTPAEGAYIFNAPGDVKTFVEIPLDYYMGYNEEGEEVQMIASDTHGPIWEAAKAAVESGDYTDEQYTIYNTNVVEGEGIGRGWKHQEMTGIVVTNHQLLIGTCAGSEALQTEKVFAGNWYSVGGWTLTLIEKGDNTGWDGPVADGIADVKTATTVADGVYTISGVKQAKMQRGLNIIVRGGKAQKVIVK